MNWKIVNRWQGASDKYRDKEFANPTVGVFNRVSQCGEATSFFVQFFSIFRNLVNAKGEDYAKFASVLSDPISNAFDYAYIHSRDLWMNPTVLFAFNESFDEPFGDSIAIDNGETLSTVADKIANSFLNRYGNSLMMSANALLADYNPIENYRMTEKENVGTKITVSTDNQNDVYGFNSNSSVPSAKQVGSSISTGNKTDNERELIRSGNIGVTTSQQMIESEIALRKKNLIGILFDYMDEFFTIRIYC